MNPQQKVIAIAGGSFAIVLIGFAVFLLRRKQQQQVVQEDDNRKDNKKEEESLIERNDSVASASQSHVEVKVPAHVVGTIIGKNGINIRQLKQELGVRFDFEKEEDGNINMSEKNDRSLTIRGKREKVHAAEQRIKRIISEAPTYVDTEIFVPQEALGRIIGKSGNTIRELSNISGAKITVDRHETPALGELRRIKLSGTSVQVDYAKSLIEEKVHAEKRFRLQNDKKATPTIKSISYVQLPDSDEYFQVFVSSVDSPNHIWIQLVNQGSVQLTALDKQMSETYGKLQSNEERLEAGNVRDLCAAPFANEGWFRGAITSIDIAKRSANIFFLDYGDTVSVGMDQLKKLRSEFLTLPAHAIECYLPIIPKSDSAWNTKSLEAIKEMTKCAQWIPLIAKKIGYKNLGDKKSPIIELIDTRSKDLDICEEFIRCGNGVWDESTVGPGKRIPEQKSSKVDVDIETSASGTNKAKKQESFDDFIDIDVEDVNGSLSAVLTQRPTEEPHVEIATENELQEETEQNSTLVNEDGEVDEKKEKIVNEEHELQRSLEETSRKNVLINSMELARENLVSMSNDNEVSHDDNDSFVSARSNVTLTDGDTDNTSFVTAADRLTPVNDISFEIPDLTKTSSPRGSLNDLSLSRASSNDLSRKRGSSNDLSRTRGSSLKDQSRSIGPDTKKLSGSKLEIQFIDETTHKVMSRESLNSQFDVAAVTKEKKVGKETTV